MSTQHQPARFRNTRETATKFFGKSERWLWQNTQPRGPIPCLRLGKSVFYDWSALDAWAAEQSATSETEVAR
ncbi:MAG: hypothetical protein Fues2KO_50550 [Fuerstiella sp.]